MVKGTSRQVLLVRSPDEDLFEQAIFVIKEGSKPVTEEMLLKEAERLLRKPMHPVAARLYGPVWACGGAALTGLIWLISALA